ncbi:hypothetical protein NH340_JMT09141 [Sarcoptes scabiei]|nr:hypothetical protein NH340_JMT09141 [Sarcoptes scabiei]
MASNGYDRFTMNRFRSLFRIRSIKVSKSIIKFYYIGFFHCLSSNLFNNPIHCDEALINANDSSTAIFVDRTQSIFSSSSSSSSSLPKSSKLFEHYFATFLPKDHPIEWRDDHLTKSHRKHRNQLNRRNQLKKRNRSKLNRNKKLWLRKHKNHSDQIKRFKVIDDSYSVQNNRTIDEENLYDFFLQKSRKFQQQRNDHLNHQHQPKHRHRHSNRKANERSNKKPNIILILTDDQDIELGSMHYMPRTMKIMADEGIQIPNAYSTTPMCCPSRSSMLTGLYVHNHNVYTNGENCSSIRWQQTHEPRTFAKYLSEIDYRTAYFGKYLNEYNGNHIPPGWSNWSALIKNSRYYNYTLNVNGRKIRHGDNYHLDYYPDLILNDSLQFIQYSKRFFPSKPYLMVLSFPSPHGPEDSAPQYQHLFLNEKRHRTPSWNRAPNFDKQWLLRSTPKMSNVHQQFTDFLNAKRLQTLQSVDEAVDRIYQTLKDLNELDNTYMIYTSDHGYHLGQFGLVKGKAMPFETDIRIPFFIRGPKIPAGKKLNDIVLIIDIAPTLLDIAGLKIPEHMDGISFMPYINRLTTLATSSTTNIITAREKNGNNHSNNNSNNGNTNENNHSELIKRDSFLIERGKFKIFQKFNDWSWIYGRNNQNDINNQKRIDSNQNNNGNKDENDNENDNIDGDPLISSFNLRQSEWIRTFCSKSEYRSPCRDGQKFECYYSNRFDANKLLSSNNRSNIEIEQNPIIRECLSSYFDEENDQDRHQKDNEEDDDDEVNITDNQSNVRCNCNDDDDDYYVNKTYIDRMLTNNADYDDDDEDDGGGVKIFSRRDSNKKKSLRIVGGKHRRNVFLDHNGNDSGMIFGQNNADNDDDDEFDQNNETNHDDVDADVYDDDDDIELNDQQIDSFDFDIQSVYELRGLIEIAKSSSSSSSSLSSPSKKIFVVNDQTNNLDQTVKDLKSTKNLSNTIKHRLLSILKYFDNEDDGRNDGDDYLDNLVKSSIVSLNNNFNNNSHENIERSLNNRSNDDCSSKFINSSSSINCSIKIYSNHDVWREKKDHINTAIVELQQRLFQLKDIRRYWNEIRPSIRKTGAKKSKRRSRLRNSNNNNNNNNRTAHNDGNSVRMKKRRKKIERGGSRKGRRNRKKNGCYCRATKMIDSYDRKAEKKLEKIFRFNPSRKNVSDLYRIENNKNLKATNFFNALHNNSNTVSNNNNNNNHNSEDSEDDGEDNGRSRKLHHQHQQQQQHHHHHHRRRHEKENTFDDSVHRSRERIYHRQSRPQSMIRSTNGSLIMAQSNSHQHHHHQHQHHHHLNHLEQQHHNQNDHHRHRDPVINMKRWQNRKRDRKNRRRGRFENTECRIAVNEQMNCFIHDNDHWKTPPLWTNGPFCFCQNSINSSFWCMRTINETHNTLYCEFVTGFISFYDLNVDPYQVCVFYGERNDRTLFDSS